jgi:hypothetical protein
MSFVGKKFSMLNVAVAKECEKKVDSYMPALVSRMRQQSDIPVEK